MTLRARSAKLAIVLALLRAVLGQACDDNNTCPHDDYRTHSALKHWSIAGFWVGAPLLAAGVGAVVWSGYQEEHAPNNVAVRAWVGPASAGVAGRF